MRERPGMAYTPCATGIQDKDRQLRQCAAGRAVEAMSSMPAKHGRQHYLSHAVNGCNILAPAVMTYTTCVPRPPTPRRKRRFGALEGKARPRVPAWDASVSVQEAMPSRLVGWMDSGIKPIQMIQLCTSIGGADREVDPLAGRYSRSG